MSECNHIIKINKCQFCNNKICNKCFIKCDECGKKCCIKCKNETLSNEHKYIMCPSCSQGITSCHYIMKNKDCGRCTDCGHVCLPIEYKKIKTDNYDLGDWTRMALGGIVASACCLAKIDNPTLITPDVNIENDTTKFNHFQIKYYCRICNKNFFKNTKSKRFLFF